MSHELDTSTGTVAMAYVGAVPWHGLGQSMPSGATPDEMRGRVSAVNSVFIGASNQLGEFESGATAAWLGPVASVVAGGVGTVLVVLAWSRLFPALARHDRLGQPADHERAST